MEIIKIGSDSFKISLTVEEAQKLEISKNSGESLGNSVKTLLLRSNLRSEIDFERDKVSTEIFIAKDGACDIFVTKQVKANVQKSKKEASQTVLYLFENLHNLCLLCRRLENSRYNIFAKAYYDKNNGKYYLLLVGIYPKDIKYAFLGEYGEKMKNTLISKIEEECQQICEKNPVENLSNLL